MLWHKTWLETRSRFLIGLILLLLSAAGTVVIWPRLVELLPLASNLQAKGEIGRRIREAIDLSREYHGYVWSHWFGQNMMELGTVLAVLLGTGGLLSQSSKGTALFTLSLPVSRNRLLGVRAATGLAEFLVLAIAPSLLIPILSPAIGKTYGVGDTLIHGMCVFIAGAVFFSLAFLLSTIFTDLWRPLLIPLFAAAVIGGCELLFRGLSPYGIFQVMSGEVYFRNGQLPWLGLLACAAASAAMLYGATINIARRDF